MSVGGARLAPGRYVVLTMPRVEQWAIVFHTTPETEPTQIAKSLTKVATGTGRVERVAQPIEQFTIRALVQGAEAAFVLEWGTWRIHVPVTVQE